MSLEIYSCLAAATLLSLGVAVFALRRLPQLTACSQRASRLELGTLLAVVAIGLLAVYGRFYTGERLFSYTDVGSDTAEQYVPFYLSLLNRIREGDFSFWDFNYGLGASITSYQSWLLDPFNLVLVPLGLLLGNSALAQILVAVQSLKVLCSALLFDALLTRYCRAPLSRILGATVFAFSGCLILWGQHYWLGSIVVLATLLTLELERLMEQRTTGRFLGVAVATALPVLMSAYAGFMVLLYAAIYAALRVASQSTSSKEFLAGFGTLALPVVCGLVTSSVTLVPYASFLFSESSRVSGSSSSSTFLQLFELVPLRWVPVILSRLLGTSLLSSAADIPDELMPSTELFPYVNVYEVIQLGLSCGALMLLSQFIHWARSDADHRTQACVLVAAALIALYCFNYCLPALFNALVAPKYRSVFAVTIPLCLALSVGFDKRIVCGKTAIAPLVASGILTLAILVWSLACSLDGKKICAFYLAAATCLIAALTIPTHRKNLTAPALICACGLIAATSLADAYMVTNNRTTSDMGSFPDATETNHASDTLEALAWIKEQDDGLYRVEKLYQDWTRFEDSMIQDYMGISSYNSTIGAGVSAFYRMLWPEAIQGDIAYQEFIADPDQPELLRLLCVKYLLAHDELTYNWCDKVAQFGDVLVYRVDDSESLVTASNYLVTESEAMDMSVEERRAIIAEGGAIISDEADTDEIALQQNATISTTISAGETNVLEGSISSTADTVACLAIPYASTWCVTVDGEQVETYVINYGFIGFNLSAGNHTITVSFSPAGLSIGIVGSVLGLAATVVTCVLAPRIAHRRYVSRASSSFSRPRQISKT